MLKNLLILFIAFLIAFTTTIKAIDKELEKQIKEYIQTLNKAIKEKNDPLRNKMYFKFRLIEQDNPGVVAPYLIENLKSNIPGVPEYTAFILGWIADKRAVEPLKKMLKMDDSKKRAAMRALGNMEATEALEDIAKLLQDPNPRVRQDAAYSLGIMGDERAIPYLKEALGDEDELVRFFAKEAISRIENRKKYGW